MCAKHADNIDIARVKFYVNKPLLLVKILTCNYILTHHTVISTYGSQIYYLFTDGWLFLE